MSVECPTCGDEFKNRNGLGKHHSLVHGESLEEYERKNVGDVGCPSCDRVFESKSGLRIHHAKTHDESIAFIDVVCDYCGGEITKRKTDYEKTDGTYCDKECSAAHHIEKNREQKLAEDPEREQCPTCGDVFANELGVRQHHQRAHDSHIISDEELLDDLRSFADELGRTPTADDMTEQGDHGANTYIRRFGMWNEAVEEAGLTPTRPSSEEASKAELLADIHRLAAELGRRPNKRDLPENGEYSDSSYRRYFGSWDDAMVAAGYEPYQHPTGEDNPMWKGGHDGYYGPNWDEQREKAIQRDGEQCAITGCTVTRDDHYEQQGYDFHVHHIRRKEDFRRDDGTLDYESANRLPNLITLCHSHHAQYEGVPMDVRHSEGELAGD